jgi:hypothetical protein
MSNYDRTFPKSSVIIGWATLSEFKVGFERSDMQLFSYILNHLIQAANISHVV